MTIWNGEDLAPADVAYRHKLLLGAQAKSARRVNQELINQMYDKMQAEVYRTLDACNHISADQNNRLSEDLLFLQYRRQEMSE